MNDLQNSIGKRVAFGGFTVALALICLYLTNVLPTNRLLFYALGTMFISTIVIEFGVPTAIVTYIAINILGFIILPNKILMIPYLLFFGYYGIVKYYIEKMNHLVIEWFIKLVCYNSTMILNNYVITKILGRSFLKNDYFWLVIALIEIAFVIYDLGYSVAIGYYTKHISKRLRR